jgi:hypothetical protein
MAVAVLGWFLADAGAHGNTTDALRVGADAWLVGHGSHLTVNGLPLGIIPLALTMVFAVAAFRAGRWAGMTSQPIDDDVSLAIGATISTGIYVMLTVIVCTLATHGGAAPSLGRATLGSLLISGVAGTLGMAVGTGRVGFWVDDVPTWVRACAQSAASGLLILLACSAVLVAVSLALGINDAATVMSGLHLSGGDAFMYTLVMVLVAPNAVLLGAAYLLGPGFAVGTGTIVSPTAVSVGAVPAFPLLAALPGNGPTPWWTLLLMGLPAIAAMIGVVLVQRRHPVTDWDLGAIRGAGAGLAAGIGTTVLVALAAGSMGTGRMADIGAPLREVFVTASGGMCLGGLVGGLAMTWWQRRALPDQA